MASLGKAAPTAIITERKYRHFWHENQGNPGKDRTGAAAAILLTALGVSRDLIFEDYLLTQQFFERSCELILKEGGPFLASIPRAIWEPLMRVHPDYLHSMFEQLEASHGSVSGYMRDLLGIDQPDIERLRANLLE